MEILKTVEEVRAWRDAQSDVAFVPTMGNLHEGHLSLVAKAHSCAPSVIVSIFVNPLQFGEGEDLENYPRTIDVDIEKLTNAGVSALFLPTAEILYGEDEPFIIVPPKSLIADLCGKDRPGHFEGVATVVAKLFNIVNPTVACFGKKDYQQLKVLEAMVKALNFNIQIVPVDIERSAAGLALSSRNGYLSDAEKNHALQLSQTLQAMKAEIEAIHQNIHQSQDQSTVEMVSQKYQALENKMSQLLQTSGFEVDYLTIREQSLLKLATEKDRNLIILVAAKVGNTRLLDNIEMDLAS
ncbi:pantoate--beta-alanine ligase [Ignatzschineria sp. LJL83]